MYNNCMNNRRISKKDIENDLVRIFEKYPKSLEKAISISFNLILDCFVAMFGEKKTIKVLKRQKSRFVTENTPKNKDKLEKQLKGVKNSAKTQGFK